MKHDVYRIYIYNPVPQLRYVYSLAEPPGAVLPMNPLQDKENHQADMKSMLIVLCYNVL